MILKKKNNFNGFTLIELLVVISIIAIIAAILFPAFATVREKARQTTCVSNLKQLSQAIIVYAQDNDEVYPFWNWNLSSQSGTLSPNHLESLWFDAVYPYVKSAQVFTCPDAGDQRTLRATDLAGWVDPAAFNTCGIVAPLMNQHIDYGYNEPMSTGLFCGSSGACSDATIQNPTGTLLLADCDLPLTGSGTLIPSATNPSDPVHKYIMTRVAFSNVHYESMLPGAQLSSFTPAQLATLESGRRHVEGSNIAFVDGHAKYWKADSITFDLFIGYSPQ